MNTNLWAKTARARMACLALVVSLTVAACGSSDTDGAATNKAAGGGSYDLAKVKADVKRLSTGSGTYESPPTSAPKPEPGKNIWLISCGQAFVTCNVPMAAAKDAAKVMGWRSHLFDTKGDYTTATQGIQQAIADNADGIVLFFMDCKFARRGLQLADKAGIPVVAAQSADCNETSKNAEPLFDYVSTYTGGIDGPYPDKQASFAKYFEDWGRVQAMAAIAATDGKANALVFNDNISFSGGIIAKAMMDEYERCDGCEAKLIEFPIGELSTGLRARAEQQLLKNPKVNVVSVSYDNIATAGVAEAVAASRRDIYVTLGEGTPPGMEVLHKGKADIGAGLSLRWDTWQSIDALNRIFHDEKPVPSGVGIHLFDKSRPAADNGEYKPPFDFEAIYAKAWTGGAK